MNKKNKFIALVTSLTLFCSQAQGQECGYQQPCAPCAPADDCCEAYCDSGRACCYSAAIPIGALVVAAIIIAATSRGGGGHHHHSSGSGSSSSSSSSYSPYNPYSPYSPYGPYSGYSPYSSNSYYSDCNNSSCYDPYYSSYSVHAH